MAKRRSNQQQRLALLREKRRDRMPQIMEPYVVEIGGAAYRVPDATDRLERTCSIP
jgi:hypothetical protein